MAKPLNYPIEVRNLTILKLNEDNLTDHQKILMLSYLMGLPLEWRWISPRSIKGMLSDWDNVWSPSWNFNRAEYRIKGTDNHNAV